MLHCRVLGLLRRIVKLLHRIVIARYQFWFGGLTNSFHFYCFFSQGEYYGHLSAERKQEIDNLRTMALLRYLAKFTLVGDRFQSAWSHLKLNKFSRLTIFCTYFINIRL